MPKKTKAANMTVAEVHAYLGKLIADGREAMKFLVAATPMAPHESANWMIKKKSAF